MSCSSVSSSTYTQNAQDPKSRMEDFMKKLQGDDSDQGKALYSAMQKMQADIKGGTADQTTLDTDRKAVGDAMKAYRTAKGQTADAPPPPPGQGPDGTQSADATQATQGTKGHHHHHHGGGGSQNGSSNGNSNSTFDYASILSKMNGQSEQDANADPGQLFSLSA